MTLSKDNAMRLRAETVGSFLRPEKLKRTYREFVDGDVDGAELASVQDDSIVELLARQKEHGLRVATDGEYRRFNYMQSFALVGGLEAWTSSWSRVIGSLADEKPSVSAPEHGVNPLLVNLQGVTERLALRDNAPLHEFTFAQERTDLPVKVTLLNPDRVLQSLDIDSSPDYAGRDELMRDIVRVEREIVDGLHNAGCAYVQLDAPGYTAYVDDPSIEGIKAQHDDPATALTRAIAADNEVVAAFPDVTFGVHMCRGNRHSQWHREGAYDPIAEQLFAELNCDRFLLEYDDERSGGFEPLRFVPAGKIVVLGLITTKSPALETKDSLLRRIEEAAKYVPVEQLAISPQCGFASDVIGNSISEEAQWRKLDLMNEVAAEVWPADTP